MNNITISTKLNCTLEVAWHAYTEGKHMQHWDYANEDWYCPFAETDLLVGGKLKVRMEAIDGSFGFDFEAVYSEIELYKKLAFTLGDGRHVLVQFSKSNAFVSVEITFDADNKRDYAVQRDDWQGILENYRKYAESL